LASMGKVGKTFTCDVKVLLWLEQYAKEKQKKESQIVNGLLNSMMRSNQTWKCSECDANNHNDNQSCYTMLSNGEFCKGVKA